MSNLPDIEIFTALADKYGDSINTLQKAEEFFDDFFKQTVCGHCGLLRQ